MVWAWFPLPFYQSQKVPQPQTCLALLLTYFLARQKHQNKPEFLKFCHQLYHTCLTKVFQPLKAGMTSPKTIHCPDGHWQCAIYSLGLYIANYPEQVFLAGIVQNWCPKNMLIQALCSFHLSLTLADHRCKAKPENLDALGSLKCSHKKTGLLIECFDPGILWKDFGICSDIMVSKFYSYEFHCGLNV